MRSIDINCDLGEGYGVYTANEDSALLDLVSSANIACGFHAGDASHMRRTVRLCLDKGVAIGAHPGLPDLNGFGRREMTITPQEAYDITMYQLGALDGFVRSEGGVMHHVKPHGALYNMAARDALLAEAIVAAIWRYDRQLLLYGLAESELIHAARKRGLGYAEEAFADRAYLPEGKLMPRSCAGAVLPTVESAVRQALQIVMEGRVKSEGDLYISLQAHTICVHGDGTEAQALLHALRTAMEQEGIVIATPGKTIEGEI